MTQPLTAVQVIELLDLQPLEGEGGFFRQTYLLPGPGDHPRTTAILYLITPTSWSGLHRLVGDELFHHYLGDPCQMVVCDSGGKLGHHRLGTDLLAGEQVQVLVPGGTWQGAKLAAGGDHGFALLGTTMTPGFRPDQFELATASDLAGFDPAARSELLPFLAPESPE